MLRRCAGPKAWTGETEQTIEIADVPMQQLYEGYADLSRMTEWSPLLDSVTTDPDCPSRSVWVMQVPRALHVPAKTLGYTTCLSWSADLEAAGLPVMNWTSVLNEEGKLKGIENAAFVPSGSIEFNELGPNLSSMTLRLRYALPEPTARWKVALIQSLPVQFVLQSRMAAGLKRFAKTMRREWAEQQQQQGQHGEHTAAVAPGPASAPPLAERAS